MGLLGASSSRLGLLSIAAACSVGLIVTFHAFDTGRELPEAALAAAAAAFARIEHGIVGGGGANDEGKQTQARHLFGGGLFPGGRSNGGSRTKRISGGGGGGRYGDSFRRPSGGRNSPLGGQYPSGGGGSRYGDAFERRPPSKPSYNSPPTYKSPPSYGGGGYCGSGDDYIDDVRECGGDSSRYGRSGGTRIPRFKDYQDVEEIIHEAIDNSNCLTPMSLVRLSFHESTGYMDGFVDLEDPENFGLGCAIDVLDDIFEHLHLSKGERIKCVLSKADFYSFSFIAAVKYAAAAAAHRYIPDITVRWGRRTYKPKSSRDRGPEEFFPVMSSMSNGEQVLDYFSRYYDFSPKQAVAILGAHTLGMAQRENSGHENPWTPNFKEFDETFYSVMREIEWELVAVGDKFQWKSCTGGGSWGDTRGQCFGLMLHVDMGLYRDIDDYVCTGKGSQAKFMDSNEKCKVGEIIGYPGDSKCGRFVIGGSKPILATCFHLRRGTSDDVAEYSENRKLWIDEFAEAFDMMISKRTD